MKAYSMQCQQCGQLFAYKPKSYEAKKLTIMKGWTRLVFCCIECFRGYRDGVPKPDWGKWFEDGVPRVRPGAIYGDEGPVVKSGKFPRRA